jgi:predicted transcriptional regulator
MSSNLITHAADIAAACVASNKIAAGDLPRLVQDIHQALASLGKEQQTFEKRQPVVSVRSSVKPDHLVCLVCGAKQKTLKRHLMTSHNLTPQGYRDEFGLPDSYPLTSADYSERRRQMAKTIGLGRKKGEKPGPRKNGRKKA